MRRLIFAVLIVIPVLCLLSIAVYNIPAVETRLAPRIDQLRTRIVYALNPPEEAVFIPQEQEQQVRTRFSQAFRYVVSQRLLPKIGGGRQAVLEILKSTMRTRDYVLKGETDGRSLTDAMHDGGTEGMQCFDDQLEILWNDRVITKETAMLYASNATNLALRMTDEPEPSEEEGEGDSMLSMLE